MIEEDRDTLIEALTLLLRKRNAKIKVLKDTVDTYTIKNRSEYDRYRVLKDQYYRLNNKFEANFKFHSYIKDVLDQTADLMENYNAVREQGETVQEGVQAAGRKRRARKSHGAATR